MTTATKTIKVSGRSDDLVCVEYDGRLENFELQPGAMGVISLDVGTVFGVKYYEDGTWGFLFFSFGEIKDFTRTETNDEQSVTLVGEFKWFSFGEGREI